MDAKWETSNAPKSSCLLIINPVCVQQWNNPTDPNPILESAAFLPLLLYFQGFFGSFRADPFGVFLVSLVLLAEALLFQGMEVVQTEGHKQGREQAELCSQKLM